MKKGMLVGAAVGMAAYWASRQPGGVPGTWRRLTQGLKDVQAGQDPVAVGKQFISGRDEEPAGIYTDEAAAQPGYQEPYRDFVSEG